MPGEAEHPAERGQLVLPFAHAPGYDWRDLVPAASNRAALAWLGIDRPGTDRAAPGSAAPGWPDGRLALWGPAGCGKSHLLHIWAERAGARVLRGQALHDLDALPDAGAVALDDAANVASEPRLLHLLNSVRDRGLRLLLAARLPPSRWPVRLADLSSRLRAIAAVEIRPPGDDLLAALLMRLLSDRQLIAAQAVQHLLLTRLPRSPGALRDAVARLDRASMTSGKAITRTLAERIIREDGSAAAGADGAVMPGFDPSASTQGLL